MRRHLLTLALAAAFGVLAATDASACHKRGCSPAHCPVPTPCVVVVPCPPPAPPCPPPAPKCGLFKHVGGCGHQRIKIGGLCHKRPACPPPVVCESPVVYAAPVQYSAPAYYAAPSPQASPQAYGSGQGS